MKELIEFIKKIGHKKEAAHLRKGSTVLKLSYLGDKNVIELAKLLKTNTTITHFELEESLIEYDGVEALIQALQTNYTITNCTIFLAGNYEAIVGADYGSEQRMYEEIERIDPLIDRNKEYVKKLSLFINNLFSIDNENIAFSIKNLTTLNSYHRVDKQLLKKYLAEQEVGDIETKLEKVDSFIKSYPFALSYVYKNVDLINENEQIIQMIDNAEKVEITGNSHCNLS